MTSAKKGSLNPLIISDASIKRDIQGSGNMQTGEKATPSFFDQETNSRLELLAKERGISPQMLVSEIVMEHFLRIDSSVDKGIQSKPRRLKGLGGIFPLRFIDPSDTISVEEDFRDLA